MHTVIPTTTTTSLLLRQYTFGDTHLSVRSFSHCFGLLLSFFSLIVTSPSLWHLGNIVRLSS